MVIIIKPLLLFVVFVRLLFFFFFLKGRRDCLPRRNAKFGSVTVCFWRNQQLYCMYHLVLCQAGHQAQLSITLTATL